MSSSATNCNSKNFDLTVTIFLRLSSACQFSARQQVENNEDKHRNDGHQRAGFVDIGHGGSLSVPPLRSRRSIAAELAGDAIPALQTHRS